MNGWGLPDWRDASNYGDTKSWSEARWRWEFYRRREDLRAFFDEHAAAIYQNRVACNLPPLDLTNGTGRLLKPDEPGFVVDGYREPEYGAVVTPIVGPTCAIWDSSWGYVFGIPNPRISEQPESIIRNFFTPSNTSVTVYGRGDRPMYDECNILPVIEGQVGILFFLDQPIARQIAHAAKTLGDAQIKKHGKKLQNRSQKAKRLNYLRALDAREDGASWAQIATVLPLTNRRDEQAARDTWDQARCLCFNF